jgi:hypothetical protein
LESWLGASPHGFESHILRALRKKTFTNETVKKPQIALGLLSFGSFGLEPQDVTWLTIQCQAESFEGRESDRLGSVTFEYKEISLSDSNCICQLSDREAFLFALLFEVDDDCH